jgi:CRP/FNR family transcriptional regulator
MRNVCMPTGLSAEEGAHLDRCIQHRRRLKAGQYLYRAGDRSAHLYAVRRGFIKTLIVTDDGREQVTGFHMMGDIIGTDAIDGRAHSTNAVVLEDTEVCEMSCEALDGLMRDMHSMRRRLFAIMNEEIMRERNVMMVLGTLRAEERLASFLLDLGERYAARGFSPTRFVLRMSRAEMGSYLGLRLETVSRLFSRFQKEGLLKVDQRSVEMLDLNAMRLMIGDAH